jgi:hypothetical protein
MQGDTGAIRGIHVLSGALFDDSENYRVRIQLYARLFRLHFLERRAYNAKG